MAQIYPLAPTRPGELAPSLYGYECTAPSGFRGRGLLCLLRLTGPANADPIVFRAQQSSSNSDVGSDHAMPIMLFDDPASTLDSLLFSPGARLVAEQHSTGSLHRLTALNDLHYINILCTELQEKRLILAANDATWIAALNRSRRSPAPHQPEHKTQTTPIHRHGYLHLQPPRLEDALPILLLNEERAEFAIEAVHRFAPDLSAFVPQRFLDQARLLFQIDPLPAALTVGRAQYLLTHGNELGPAMIALIGNKGFLFKARLDVIEALLPSGSPDIAILDLLLRRTLNLDLNATHTAPDLPAAIHASHHGVPLAFLLNPPSLQQVQHAAFLHAPLPTDTFRVFPQLPHEWIRDYTSPAKAED